MNATEILDTLAQLGVQYKNDLCEDSGGPADGQPLIIGVDANGEQFIMPDLMEGHPTDNLPYLLNYLSNGLEERNGTLRWEWLAYVVEGYVNPSDSVTEFERGAFHKDFKYNPASAVKEGVIITVFTWEGEARTRTLMYHYGDDGMPVWEEPLEGDDYPEGKIPLIFKMFQKFCEHEGEITEMPEGE